MLMIGVISYLPKDEKLRAKRLSARRKQAQWLRETFPDKQVFVVAQCYKQEELDANETNIVFENGIGPGAARNVLLKEFYSSNFDHILILDDDISIYDYYNPYEFLKDLNDNPNKYKSLDVILGSTPQFLAFKRSMFNDKYNRTHFKFSKKSPYWTSELSIFSQLKNKDLFDESMKNGEDADIHIRLMRDGYKVYVADFLQMKLLLNSNGESSAIFVEGNKSRTNEEREQKFNLARKYGINIKGSIVQFKKWLDDNGIKYETPLYIPRLTEYVFPPNLIPKEKDERKKLF